MNNTWNTSVTELLTIFKGALLSIIPWLEKAQIKWKEGESYDDWDNIAEALYQNIVCASLKGEIMLNYPIAKYNFNYDNYSVVDFIEVKRKIPSNNRMVFVSFISNTLPLDSIKIAYIDNNSNVINYSILENCELDFLYITQQGNEEKKAGAIKVNI